MSQCCDLLSCVNVSTWMSYVIKCCDFAIYIEEDETMDHEDPAPPRGETGHQQWVTLSRGEKSKPDFVSH